MSQVARHGSWPSPITAERIAGASLRLGQTAVCGGTILWTEGRPEEQGRNVLVRAGADGVAHDLTPAPWNVRSRVHEYGGGAFTIDAERGDAESGAGTRGVVIGSADTRADISGKYVGSRDSGSANAGDAVAIFFCHFDDQRIYRRDPGGSITAVTAAPGMRYADAVVDSRRQRLIAVREDHSAGSGEPVNALVAIDLVTGAERVLAGGHDFVSTPRLSPDGGRLAWLTWDHPEMPWDGTELWVAGIMADGSLATAHKVAGGRTESIFQPAWSPGGELHFVSDRSGWWNLYRERAGRVEALCPMAAEFGEPHWVFAMSTYGFDGHGRIVCTYLDRGVSRLGFVDAAGGGLRDIATPCTSIRELKVGAGFIAFFGGSATAPEALIRLDLESGRQTTIRSSGAAPDDPAQVSVAEAISYPSGNGAREAHAFYYAPRHRDFEGPAAERPPLLVIDHGGPTGATNATLRWAIQFWTHRGFAVVDVNYGGSTGYGRAYRERLKGRWGIVDVEDSIAAARFLVRRGDVDPTRLAIRGSSAGGYTTLAALTFHDDFAAGASHYGIGDLEALARDTHKFESRYLDGLVGPYPEAQALYRARSPIHHSERLSSALILFQGAEDKVVPPAQAEAMYAAVRAKGLPVAYLLFEHEQHGFRHAANIRRALEAELFFYGKVLGFGPADRIEPVAIENLP